MSQSRPTPSEEVAPKRKQRRKMGNSLFISRMKREGRYQEYREHVRRYLAEGVNGSSASYKAILDMGYEGPKREHEIHMDFMAYGDEYLGRVDAVKEANEANKMKESLDLRDALASYDIEESDLPQDIAFVFHSLHKAIGERMSWLVGPHEAPTPGAWNMLVWAVENQGKFFEMVIREQLKKNEKVDDQGMGDTGESVEQIERLLGELTSD